jgi:hypothetical protein
MVLCVFVHVCVCVFSRGVSRKFLLSHLECAWLAMTDEGKLRSELPFVHRCEGRPEVIPGRNVYLLERIVGASRLMKSFVNVAPDSATELAENFEVRELETVLSCRKKNSCIDKDHNTMDVYLEYQPKTDTNLDYRPRTFSKEPRDPRVWKHVEIYKFVHGHETGIALVCCTVFCDCSLALRSFLLVFCREFKEGYSCALRVS